MAELLLARELQRSSIGKLVLAWAPWRSCWHGQLAKTAGGNSRRKQPAEKQTGNGHLTELARSVNLANQAQGVNLAELVRLSFWQTRSLRDREEIVKRS